MDHTDFEILKRLVLQDRQVDLVRLGPFMNFMFTDDYAYRDLDDTIKRRTINELARHSVTIPECPQSVEKYIATWTPASKRIYEFAIAHYVLAGPTMLLDVGCQYGSFAMEAAMFLRSIGKRAPILAFDCGQAGALAEFNIENNGFAEEIAFINRAVGATDKYVLVHRDLGHSADNRTVNPAFDWGRGSISFPVKGVRLDTLFREGKITVPFLAKIDTQGAEPEVLEGARELLIHGRHALLMEFTPDAVRPRISGEQFLRQLLAKNRVFDVGIRETRVDEVTAESAAAFSRQIDAAPEKWTDLLVLSRGFDVNDRIITALEGHFGARRRASE